MGDAPHGRLELTWWNKDLALIPTTTGKYGYDWVHPNDPRYCETHYLIHDDHVGNPDDGGLHDNLLITGDSGDVLEALTRVPELVERYVGKVKLAYLDPPFNTRHAFKDYDDALEHSVWLTMMRDRLLNIRTLLSDDGSVWVHLDLSENHRMRSVLDELFGANNFVAEVVWQKADSGRNDSKGFSVDQDVILVYGKPGFSGNRTERTEKDNERFTNPDDDPNGPWWDDNPTAPNARTHQGMVYAIQHPITGENVYPSKGRCWSFEQSEMLRIFSEYADYELRELDDAVERARRCEVDPEDVRQGVKAIMLAEPLDSAAEKAWARYRAGNWPTYVLRSGGTGGFGRKSYVPRRGNIPRTWWSNSEVGQNRTAKAEIKALFKGEDVAPFATPKPEKLLKRVLEIASHPGDIVLDCFAGSGTTAAVAHKMGRRWVTCELLPETVATYTRPRLKKVIDGEQGGISRATKQLIPAEGVELPTGITPQEALALTELLDVLEEQDGFDAALHQMRERLRTERVTSLAWPGGGGFTSAHLSPSLVMVEEDGTVWLTEAATDPEVFASAMCAELGFKRIHDQLWSGERGHKRLFTIPGLFSEDMVSAIVEAVPDGWGAMVVAHGYEPDARVVLRRALPGSRVLQAPADIFKSGRLP